MRRNFDKIQTIYNHMLSSRKYDIRMSFRDSVKNKFSEWEDKFEYSILSDLDIDEFKNICIESEIKYFNNLPETLLIFPDSLLLQRIVLFFDYFELFKKHNPYFNLPTETEISGAEAETDDYKDNIFSVPQKVKILDKLNVKGWLMDKGLTVFQIEKLLSDLFDRSDKTIRDGFKNDKHQTTAENYINELKTLKAKR